MSENHLQVTLNELDKLLSDFNNRCPTIIMSKEYSDPEEYHARYFVEISQRLSMMSIEMQRNSTLWLQGYCSNKKPREYWPKLQKLDKGKYRISSERSLHMSVG